MKEGVENRLVKEPVIRSKRQKVAEAFGRVLRGISPTRSPRQSHGKSVGKRDSLASSPVKPKAA